MYKNRDFSNVLLSCCIYWLLGYRFHISGVKFHLLSDFPRLYISHTQPTFRLNCRWRLAIAIFKIWSLPKYIICLGVFKPGALHPVTPAPIKALPCLCFFPLMAEKSKPPAPRVVGDSIPDNILSIPMAPSVPGLRQREKEPLPA